jgi:hypothetical protein
MTKNRNNRPKNLKADHHEVKCGYRIAMDQSREAAKECSPRRKPWVGG